MKLFFVAAILSFQAVAIDASYVSFKAPSGWKCSEHAAIWNCESPLNHEKGQMYLLVTAIPAPTKKLSELPAAIRKLFGNLGKPGMKVDLKSKRERKILETVWIDMVERETKPYRAYGRKVVTLSKSGGKDIAVVLSLWAKDEVYPEVASTFDEVVDSLALNPYRLWRPVATVDARAQLFQYEQSMCKQGSMPHCETAGGNLLGQDNLVAAAPFLITACNAGMKDSCAMLGDIYVKQQNPEEARKAFQAGCKNGGAMGCLGLSMMLLQRGEKKKSEDTMDLACQLGAENYCVVRGEILLKAKRVAEAKKLFARACNLGDGRGCWQLATKNRPTYLSDMKRGCRAGYGPACLIVSKAEKKATEKKSYTNRALEVLPMNCKSGDKHSCELAKVFANNQAE